jgi:hypothetical protein
MGEIGRSSCARTSADRYVLQKLKDHGGVLGG